MSWLSSEELRECEPSSAAAAPSGGRRGNAGPASCKDEDDADVVVTTAFLSLLLAVNDAVASWPADGGGGSCVGPGTNHTYNTRAYFHSCRNY